MEKSPDAFRTISEVADWLGTPTHVLRFWESRFSQIKPVKRAGGRRYYRPSDMALLGGIKKLLHDDGLTIRGVQKILREEGVKHVASLSPPVDGAEAPVDEAPAPTMDAALPEPDTGAATGSDQIENVAAAEPVTPETEEPPAPQPEDVAAQDIVEEESTADASDLEPASEEPVLAGAGAPEDETEGKQLDLNTDEAPAREEEGDADEPSLFDFSDEEPVEEDHDEPAPMIEVEEAAPEPALSFSSRAREHAEAPAAEDAPDPVEAEAPEPMEAAHVEDAAPDAEPEPEPADEPSAPAYDPLLLVDVRDLLNAGARPADPAALAPLVARMAALNEAMGQEAP